MQPIYQNDKCVVMFIIYQNDKYVVIFMNGSGYLSLILPLKLDVS